MYKLVLRGLRNPKRAIQYLLTNSILAKIISDKKFIKIKYELKTNKKLNLENPTTFNEKLQWLKLNDRKPIYTQMVDKYEVRKYVKEIIGEKYLIPLIGVYNSFAEIDFDDLPNEFVLKCTHDSGGVVICKNKKEFDILAAKRKIENRLKRNYFWFSREWPYKNIKPRIICEKLLKDETEQQLIDYKFMCFNGKVKNVFVCLNRNSEDGLKIDIYDKKWNLMPFYRPSHPNSGILTSKPRNYNLMVEFAEKLSKNISFLRVDFYEVNGQLYFGELTFYPASGFEEFVPESYNELLGAWIKLPEKEEISVGGYSN